MNIKKIEKLVSILERSKISEIELTDLLGRKVRISKSSFQTQTSPAVSQSIPVQETDTAPQPDTVKKPSAEESDGKMSPIKSPIVGTFYRSPAPDAPPYVEIGDIVKPGQVVCIVEAMKLLNEIESDVAGKVVKILVENEDPVEYNQDLFLVEQM